MVSTQYEKRWSLLSRVDDTTCGSWVSTGAYEATGVNPDSKSGGRDSKAIDGLILFILWHPLQLCRLQTYWLCLSSGNSRPSREGVSVKWAKHYLINC